jgi:hypothetical protein
MTTRASHKAPLRRRPFTLKAVEVTPSNRRGRHTILTPTKGYRIRLARVKVVQPEPDGRRLCEIYFGTAGNLITAPSRAVDVLAVPDRGTASTRAYPRDQGPRGKRGEPLSLRWRGRRPSTAHKVIIEYTEES